MSIVLSVVNGPSSQKKGNDQDGKRNEDLENFCKHEGTAKNQSEPVDGNSKGEESVAEVEEEHQEDMKHTEANIIIRQADEDDKDVEVTQTEEAVKDDQPIKKGFGSLI